MHLHLQLGGWACQWSDPDPVPPSSSPPLETTIDISEDSVQKIESEVRGPEAVEESASAPTISEPVSETQPHSQPVQVCSSSAAPVDLPSSTHQVSTPVTSVISVVTVSSSSQPAVSCSNSPIASPVFLIYQGASTCPTKGNQTNTG